MKIYTRAGDDGGTALFGGARVSKASLRVETYGTVDELNSAIGVARTESLPATIDAELATIQSELFDLGAELATVPEKRDKLTLPTIEADDTARLEAAIDALDVTLEPLTTFVLPGGSKGAAALHLARTIARRAERGIVALAAAEPVRPELVKYVNRLSDLLFTMARAANRDAGIADVPWNGRERAKVG